MSKEKPWVAVVHIRDKHCDVCGSEIYNDELYYTRAWR
jgi:predicted nucleic acid-binding Zn ribbon protein